MANALPILIAGGAAVLLLGGKKKKKTAVGGKGNVFYTDDDRQLAELAQKQMGARGVGIGVPATSQRAAVISAFKAAAAQNSDLIFVISRGNLVPPEVKKTGNAAILVAGGIGGDGVIDYEDSVMVKSAADLRSKLGQFIKVARSKV